MNRRKFLVGAGALLAAPRIARAQAKKVLRFIPQADVTVLDPITVPAFVTRNHAFLVFDTLYGVDSNSVSRPQMVEGHQIEDDGKRWLLTLRDGLKFHNNDPVLAKDVVASLNRWGKRDNWGTDLFAATDTLKVVSDKVVEFRLKRPFPTLPDVLGKAGVNMPCIMPEHLASTDPYTAVTDMIGSGPFRFVAGERVSGALTVYEKFAGYVPRKDGVSDFLAGPKVVNVDRVEWRVIPDAATAAGALQVGEVDWWEQPIADMLPMLKGNDDLVTTVLDKSGVLGLLRLNHLHPPFNNSAIRRALWPAIDQAAYMTAVAGPDPRMWRDKIGFFTPGPMSSDAGMDALIGPRSREKAKQALKDAGYKGEPVILLAPADVPTLYAMALVTQDLFKGIGLNVDLVTADWGSVVRRFNSKAPPEKGGWSALCNATNGTVTANPADHRMIRGTGEAGGIWGWPSDDKLEAYRSAFLQAETEDGRKEACRKMQLEAFDNVPYIPLGIYFQPTSFRKSVTGISNGFPTFYNLKLA